VPEHETGVASAVNNTLSRLAGLVAVSLLALVLADGFAVSLGAQLGHSGLPVEVRDQIFTDRARLHVTPIPAGLTQGQRAEVSSMLDRAFLAGFRSVMPACAMSAWMGGLAMLLLLPKRSRT
jgi:hypothetical protein